LDDVKAKKRVMAVDDEPGILRILKISLRVLGYEVITAGSGKEALTLIENEKPDIILMDILMPGMDGFETLERLRTFSDVPVIVFSAHSSSSDKALALGADDFIAKPFTPETLAKKIADVLAKKGATA
jgi:CheY-like chemotaxis protein